MYAAPEMPTVRHCAMCRAHSRSVSSSRASNDIDKCPPPPRRRRDLSLPRTRARCTRRDVQCRAARRLARAGRPPQPLSTSLSACVRDGRAATTDPRREASTASTRVRSRRMTPRPRCRATDGAPPVSVLGEGRCNSINARGDTPFTDSSARRAASIIAHSSRVAAHSAPLAAPNSRRAYSTRRMLCRARRL